MKSRKLSTLGAKVREKRGDAKLRDTAKAIGISAPTLMRIEAGRIPDVQTFGKICQWLQVSPESFLGYNQIEDQGDRIATTQVAVHLKAPKLMNEETLGALSRMILLATNSQSATNTIEDDDS